MRRHRVLLSESSSLTAREFVTVLGEGGTDVGVASWSALPIARFSRWCRRVHPVPAPSRDPVGYLRAIDEIMGGGAYDALLPTHEQAWLFAAGAGRLRAARPPVAELSAFARVQSKIAFARTLDELGLPQPPWRAVATEQDVGVLGFPVWVKAALSTAGRGVRAARDAEEARRAWRELAAGGEVMIQGGAPGAYAQVQGVFAHGRLIGAASSELVASGVGGSAAARVSVDHPRAVDALRRIGARLAWHGGIDLDYFHVDGRPQFIECNPRTVEPGNAFAAGVDLPGLLTAVATGAPLPEREQVAAPGIRTRSTLAVALGAADGRRTRRAVIAALAAAVARRGPLARTTEVLTPVLRDPPSIVPCVYVVGALLASPARASRLAGQAVADYAVTVAEIDAVRATGPGESGVVAQ